MTPIDMSYDGKTKRVFGALWGAMTAAGFNETQISTLKPIAWRSLDGAFEGDYDYEVARDSFTDVILEALEAFGGSDAQQNLVESALFETLRFNFDETRGNL